MGSGSGGEIFEFFFEQFRVSGFRIPVAGRAFLNFWEDPNPWILCFFFARDCLYEGGAIRGAQPSQRPSVARGLLLRRVPRVLTVVERRYTRRVYKPGISHFLGVSHFFRATVLIVSQTLSGIFLLIGRETGKGPIRKILEKFGKPQKDKKGTTRDGQAPIGKSFLPVKMAIATQRQALKGGYRRKSLPLKPIELQGASREIVSPIALYHPGVNLYVYNSQEVWSRHDSCRPVWFCPQTLKTVTVCVASWEGTLYLLKLDWIEIHSSKISSCNCNCEHFKK